MKVIDLDNAKGLDVIGKLPVLEEIEDDPGIQRITKLGDYIESLCETLKREDIDQETLLSLVNTIQKLVSTLSAGIQVELKPDRKKRQWQFSIKRDEQDRIMYIDAVEM